MHTASTAKILHSLTNDRRGGKGGNSHWDSSLKHHRFAATLGTRERGKLCRHSLVQNLTASVPQATEGMCHNQVVFLNRDFVGSALNSYERPGLAQQLSHLHGQWPEMKRCLGRTPVRGHSGNTWLSLALSLCFWGSCEEQVHLHPQRQMLFFAGDARPVR